MFKTEILEQDYNEYAEGIIDAREFYKYFYCFLKIFQVLDGPIPKYTYFIKTIMLSCVFIALGLLCFSFYHGLDTFDLPFLTEAGNYMIILSYKLLIQYCARLHVRDYHRFQRSIQEDFMYICTKGEKYRFDGVKSHRHKKMKKNLERTLFIFQDIIYPMITQRVRYGTYAKFSSVSMRPQKPEQIVRAFMNSSTAWSSSILSFYRKRFFLHQIETRKIHKLTTFFTMCVVAFGMNGFSFAFLLYHLLTHEAGEGERPLLFPFWYFETDFSKTPIYEMALMFSNFCVLAYALNYTFMIGTQIVWSRQIACKAEIIIWHLEDLMTGIRPTNNKKERDPYDKMIRQRMKDIVQHHNLMNILTEQFARVHKKLLMFEQVISAPVVCFSAYSAAEQWDEGEFNAILITILFAAVILLFVPSYLCTTLSFKVNSIAFACWNMPFWNAGPVIRPYLVLIMQRSLRPLPLAVPGFEEFSVQTFSNKMASAYSFFNMLRQANRK